MGYNYENVQRDGMTKIIGLAKALCRIVQAVKHIINGKFPDSAPISLLIEAIDALCPLIADAEIAAITYGGDNSGNLEDPSGAAGIDPTAPPAEPPVTA
jgi:hypothetical protein